MSLATRCTHCGTIFRVVQDQLKVSEGWVRCGRCQGVFNALPTLFNLETDPPPPRPAHTMPHGESGLADRPPEARPDGQPTAAQAHQAPPPARPDSAPISPSAPDAADAQRILASQGLMSDAEVNPALDSQPPSAWAKTEPAEFEEGELNEESLSLEPPSIEATTDFDLDTAIAVDDNTPLEVVLASLAPRGTLAPVAAAMPAMAVATPEAATATEARPTPVTAPDVAQEAPDEINSAEASPPLPPAAEPEAAALPQPIESPVAAESAGPISQDEASAPLVLRDTPSAMQDSDATSAGLRAGHPRSGAHADWPDLPEDLPEDLPSTDEEDALDSRYLMPNPRDRRAAPRIDDGPDFADAEFPSDADIDAEEDWASDFGASTPGRDSELNAMGGQGAGQAPTSTEAARTDRAVADDPASEANALAEGSPRAEEPGQAEAATDVGEDQAPAPMPGFVKQARRNAFWRHPAVRAVLSIVALGLVGTLTAQVGVQFRDQLAAQQPALRPALLKLCEVAHCEIKPPLKLDDLQVESATLVKASSEGADNYRLAVVVHNKGTMELAWPHVDLTLTDENGTVIARGVFSPRDAEWLDTADAKADGPTTAASALPQAAPKERSTTLQWHLRAPGIQPAGYTAELFYP